VLIHLDHEYSLRRGNGNVPLPISLSRQSLPGRSRGRHALATS